MIPVFFSLFGMLLAIFILIILMMKGFHQFFTILCAVLVVSIFSRINLHEAFTRTFLSGLTGYLDNYFFMFLWGTLLSVLMEVSGGAMSIARFLIRRLNTGAWIAIPIATGLLAYGGVFAIAATFPIIPIAREVFRAHDIPKRLMPGMLYFGCGTCFMVAPGAVQVQNLVPASALEQSRSCGLVGGWIGAGAMLIIGLVWLAAMIGKEKRLGHHWEDDGVTAAPQQVPAPHPVLALIPLIITVALINWGDGRGGNLFSIETAILLGNLSCILCMFKYFKRREFLSYFGKAVTNTITTIFGIGAIVGFGSVIKEAAGFGVLSDLAVSMSDNYLIGVAVSTALICGFCGSASGGLGIVSPMFHDLYMAVPGINLAAVSRTMSLASASLDSAPHSGAVTAIIGLCGETHKEAYIPIFYLSVVTPAIGTVIGMMVFWIFPGLP